MSDATSDRHQRREGTYRITDQKSVPLAVVITVVVSIAVGVGGLASAAVTRTESLRMETTLRQEERVRALEQKAAVSEQQFAAITASLVEIQSDIKSLVRSKP